MLLIVGYILVLASTLGTYSLHGNLASLWMPAEYLAIFGLLVAGFVAGNNPKMIKRVLGVLPSIFKGSRYNRDYYVNLLALLFELLSKVRREGLMSIENDVETPDSSPVFNKYPEIVRDHHVLEFLCDYLRMMVGGNLNTLEVEGLMEQELELHHHEMESPAHVVEKLGDSMPAYGIVICVMGVVNVMSSVGEPPPILGKMIGGALVGTFLGILVAYGFVKPVASLLEQAAHDNSRVYGVVKATLLASMAGYAPQVAVEFGRKNLPTDFRPTFLEMEEELKSRKAADKMRQGK
ncbi:MAG: flagellar motor stator protein MotA [Betaproteobacteria bacterium]|nr:flagellar motor stator protein MotA [Betaproteobacteria bacterium]